MNVSCPARLSLVPVVFAFVIAACGGAASNTTAPSESQMMEHSATPSESPMMEHSAMPSESPMMEHSPGPSSASPVATGIFHGVDGTATGTVALFHKANGSFTITFEDFAIGSAAHTDVILVANKDVTKDGDIDSTTLVDLGPLSRTSGMQDFAVPASADAMTYHTVVLWDTAMAHAIAAAPLR